MKLITDLLASDYHSTQAISKSGLDRINQSPAHFISWLSEPQKSTPAIEFGSATHSAILEADTFDQFYHVGRIDRRTKEGKAQAEEIESTGKKLISEDDFGRIMRMRDSVHSHETAKDLLSEGNAEISLLGEFANVSAKARVDWLVHTNDTEIGRAHV